jgi:histidinol dehydrogenase
MKISRFDWDGTGPEGLAVELRALQPPLAAVADEVRAIIDEVERDGDAALVRLEGRFGEAAPKALRVPPAELAGAEERAPAEVLEAMRTAVENVRRVAVVGVEEESPPVEFDDGHRIRVRSLPLSSAGAYAPGGRGAYPSTAIMCCVPAKAAGVERVAVASPPGPDGRVNQLVLAASALAGADEVYAVGGAHSIAALALGTETVDPVDVIVGPGNRYVQEAKRQLAGGVGIDGIAGPSELMVIFDRGAPLPTLALDLCAQAEHGDDGLLVACAVDDAPVAELEAEVERLAGERETVTDAPLALVTAPSPEAALGLANALAPEHLELVCEEAGQLAERVTSAGCVFIGGLGATAFGDYVAGSNHVLPTGGAGRFTGPLGPGAFHRRLATVEITQQAAQELAPAAATLARAEGFPVHGESVEARVAESKESKR